MATKQRHVALFFLLVLFAFLIFPNSLYSAGATIEMSPLSVDYDMEPGTERNFEITIANNHPTMTLVLAAFVAPLFQNRTGEYKLRDQADQWSAGPWVVFKPEIISIPPNTRKAIPVTIRVPRGALGSKYAAVAFQVNPDDKNKTVQGVGGTLAFKQYFMTIIKVTATNPANRRNASLSGVTVLNGKELKQYGDKAMAIACSVANEGNVLLHIQGRLILKNIAGQRIKDVPLGTGILLPGVTVDFQSIFTAGLPVGDYIADITVNYGGSRPILAKTPIKITSNITVNSTAITANSRFEVSPEIVESNLAGGSFRSFIVTIANLDKVPLKFVGSIKGLTSDEDGQLLPTDDGKDKYSLVPWLTLEQPAFTLSSGEKRIVRITAAIPGNATAGTRYAALTYDVQKDGGKPEGSTSISTPVMITVGREIVKAAKLTGGGVAYLDPRASWLISARLFNEGNTHLKGIKGRVIIRRRSDPPTTPGGMEYIGEAKWEDMTTIPLVETQETILPGKSLLIGALYDKEFKIGQYQAEIIADIGNEAPVRTVVIFKIAPKKK